MTGGRSKFILSEEEFKRYRIGIGLLGSFPLVAYILVGFLGGVNFAEPLRWLGDRMPWVSYLGTLIS